MSPFGRYCFSIVARAWLGSIVVERIEIRLHRQLAQPPQPIAHHDIDVKVRLLLKRQ